jgi:dTDP-4-dehydrorhamnose reductase
MTAAAGRCRAHVFKAGMKVLITGAMGQLAQEFQRLLPLSRHTVLAPSEESLDITDLALIRSVIGDLHPDVVINCAAYNNVDKAETDFETAYRVNALGPDNLAASCMEHGALFVHYSSDYVFDGGKEGFYTEADETNPINRYGETKRAGEIRVMNAASQYLIFRLSWVFGKGRQNFLYKLAEWAGKNPVLKVVSDQVSVPTYTEDIAAITMLAIDRKVSGLYHLTSSGYASRYEVARYFLEKTGAKSIILPVTSDHFPSPAKRPYFSAMSNGRLSAELGCAIPDWKNAIDRYIQNIRGDIE